MPDFDLERAAGAYEGGLVAGLDEAGRGPWAGPVVAAAVVLPTEGVDKGRFDRLNDSKKLSAAQRDKLSLVIRQEARYAVGIASVAEIDQLNILQATFLAMRRAYEGLALEADLALIDGNKLPGLPCQSQAVVKGDSRSLSIAAASIIAKTERDCLMSELAESEPHYGWQSNRGYGTKAHQEALLRYGVSRHHRRSFRPIRELLSLTY